MARTRRPISAPLRRAVIEAYQLGRSFTQIIQIHGVSRSSVHRVLIDAGIPRRPIGNPGRGWAVKLSEVENR